MARPRTTPKPRNRLGNYEKLPSGSIRARYRGEKQTFKTMDEAVSWVAGLAADRSRGIYVSPKKGRATIAEVADEWKTSLGNVRAGTAKRYVQIMENRIVPDIGKKRIGDFDRLAVKQYLASLFEPYEIFHRGQQQTRVRKPGTVRNVKAVLSLIMGAAVDGKYVVENPCEGLKIKGSKPEEMIFLDHAEVLRLAETIHPNFRLAVLIGAYCGLRAEELWGLKVKRFDEVNARLIVKTQSNNEDDADDTADDLPKSGKYRSVPVPRSLVVDLKDWIRVRGLGMDDFVITTVTGKRVQHNNFYNRYWAPAVRAAELGRSPRVHDLRHTCAAFYFARKASSETVRRVLGHTTIAMTHKYAHVFPWAFDEAIVGIDVDIEAAQSGATREVLVPRSATARGLAIEEEGSDQDILA
jgi:integrase